MKFHTKLFGTMNLTAQTSRHIVLDAFTNGNCHSFALALHKLTGWPMFGLYKDDEYPDIPHHIVVRTPRGAFLDVQGRGANRRWQKYGMFEYRPVRKGHLRQMVQKWHDAGVGLIPSNVAGALPFAERLLSKLYGK